MISGNDRRSEIYWARPFAQAPARAHRRVPMRRLCPPSVSDPERAEAIAPAPLPVARGRFASLAAWTGRRRPVALGNVAGGHRRRRFLKSLDMDDDGGRLSRRRRCIFRLPGEWGRTTGTAGGQCESSPKCYGRFRHRWRCRVTASADDEESILLYGQRWATTAR